MTPAWVMGLAVVMAGEHVPHADISTASTKERSSVVALRREIHQHPELGNREYRTGKRVAAELGRVGLHVRYPLARTGVLGVLTGGKPGRTVVVRADIDALPIVETRDTPYRSRNPAAMHACGHDAHAAIVVGVAKVLAALGESLPGRVVFLFQPAEEGPPPGESGGAALVLQEGILDEFRPQAILGLHVDPTLTVGKVGWSDGPVFASSDRFSIEVAGEPTHGAYPHLGVDPMPAVAGVIQALETLVARRTDAQAPKVLTLGRIRGGVRAGLTAERIVMDGMLRALDPETRERMKGEMDDLVASVAEGYGARGTVTFDGDGLPPLLNDPDLLAELLPTLESVVDPGEAVEVPPQMGGEDFALYAERIPAVYVRLGVRNEERGITAPLHTSEFDLDEDALIVGVHVLSALAWAAASRP